MAGKYELNVEVSATTDLKEAEAGLLRLVHLKKQYREEAEKANDQDIQALVKIIPKIDKVNAALLKQEVLVEKLKAAKAKATADQEAANAKILKSESAITNAITKEKIELEKLSALNKKVASDEQKQIEKLRILRSKARSTEEKAALDALLNEAKLAKEIKKQADEKEKAAAKAAKAARDEQSAYLKLSRQLIEMKRVVKDLVASEKILTEEDKKLIKQTQELDARLKKIDKTFGDGHRSVGLYTQGIHEALQETGLMNNGIGRLIITLNNLRKSQDAAAASTDKLNKIFKLSLIGLAIAAVAAVKELFEINQTLKDNAAILAAQTKDFLTGGNPYETLERSLIKSRIELRKWRIELLQATLDEGDQLEIAADVTIGYKERNAALDESIRLSKERAALSVKIAEDELKNIELEVKAEEANPLVGKRGVLNDLLDKRLEAELKLNEALDSQNDLERQSAATVRARNVEEAIAAVELLRSKKLSFDQQSAQLEKQLKDERIQLEQRRRIADELLSVQNKTTQEEIKLFKEKSKIQFDAQALLNQTDAVKLANQLKSITQINEEGKAVGIGQDAINELAKIVKEYQENRIKNGEEIAKIDQEELERTKKLAEINRQIAIEQQKFRGELVQNDLEQNLARQEQTNEKLLKEGNSFNRKLLKRRQSEIEIEKELREEDFNEQIKLLQMQADEEKAALDASENDLILRAAKKRQVEEKLILDLERLRLKSQQDEFDAEQKHNDDLKQLRQAQVNDVLRNLDFVAGKIDEALEKKSDKELARIDKEQEANDRALELQQSRAERGLSNELELQQKRAAELEQQREEQEKKRQRQQKITSFYNLLSGYAKEDANTALSKAARDIALSEAISLLFAEKGGIAGEISDTTTLQNGRLSKTHGNKGDVLVAMSPTEGILNDKQMSALGGKEGFYNLQAMLDNPIKDDVMFEKVPQFVPVAIKNDDRLVKEIGKEFREAIKAIPIHNSHIDNLGNIITDYIDEGFSKRVKVISQKPRFRR